MLGFVVCHLGGHKCKSYRALFHGPPPKIKILCQSSRVTIRSHRPPIVFSRFDPDLSPYIIGEQCPSPLRFFPSNTVYALPTSVRPFALFSPSRRNIPQLSLSPFDDLAFHCAYSICRVPLLSLSSAVSPRMQVSGSMPTGPHRGSFHNVILLARCRFVPHCSTLRSIPNASGL